MAGSSEARSAVVTGVGVVSAAGLPSNAGEGVRALLAAVAEGRALAAEVTAFEPGEGEPTRGAEIAEFDLARHVPSVKSYIDRTSALALAAARLALDDAGLLEEEKERRGAEVGLAYGTQWGCLDSMELFYAKLDPAAGGKARFAPPLPFSHSYANSPASVLAIELKLRGHHVVYSAGRASGSWALLGGGDAVELGRAECIACAASDSFSRAAFRHYHAAGLLLPDGAGPGGEGNRRRFVLGEGAACLVLEEASRAASRGARVRARLVGTGAAAGADEVTALEEALREALLRAGVAPGEVSGAFGASASPADAHAEVAALASSLSVPQERAREMLVPLGPALGETMGASGLLAAAAACAGIADGTTAVLCAEHSGSARSAVAVLLAAP